MSEDKKNTTNNSNQEKLTKEHLNDEQTLRSEGGDDDQLRNRTRPVDFQGKDLDIPGRTLPKNKDRNSLKDEENQLYSQGGSENEDLENNL